MLHTTQSFDRPQDYCSLQRCELFGESAQLVGRRSNSLPMSSAAPGASHQTLSLKWFVAFMQERVVVLSSWARYAEAALPEDVYVAVSRVHAPDWHPSTASKRQERCKRDDVTIEFADVGAEHVHAARHLSTSWLFLRCIAHHHLHCTTQYECEHIPRWRKTRFHWLHAQRSVASTGIQSNAFIDRPPAARQWAFHAHNPPWCLLDLWQGNLPSRSMGARGILPSVPGFNPAS